MVYVSQREDELNLWWDEREDKKAGMRYKIIINGQNCVYTSSRYYDFKNLESDKAYAFQVQLVDEEDQTVGKIEQIETSTLCAKKRIDVTKPPYNAIGDAKTDNTSIIQRAIDENPTCSEIYLPLGTYVCGKLVFNGDCIIKLDVGAQLISRNANRRIR